MSVSKTPTMKKMEWVFIPSTNSIPGAPDDYPPGSHTIVISGLVDLEINAPSDDDDVAYDRVVFDILYHNGFGPLWNQQTPLYAATTASWGEIASPDSDEVDHSAWGIVDVITGYGERIVAGSTVRTLRLEIYFHTQGEYNVWSRIGFQTVANGELVNVDDMVRNMHKTELIKL